MKPELFFVLFALLGVIDKLTGNRMRLGDEFEKGLTTAGPLILSMSGMIVLSPVLAQGLSAISRPVCTVLHMDLSVLSGFFPVDAGGATMAYALSENEQLRAYHGIIVASMLGATICPVIPMALQMAQKEHHTDVLAGLLCGIATIPVGCILTAVLVGCPLGQILQNSLLMLSFSVLICIGLWKCPDTVCKLFGIFGKVLMAFVLLGLCIGMVDLFAGMQPVPNIAPLSEAFVIIGNIAVILAGVFPMLSLVSRLLKKPLSGLSRRLRVCDTAVLGLVTTLANSIPVFSMLKQMDRKGRILNMAFAVSAGYALGDHLAFVLSFDRTWALPMVAGKLISGLCALFLAQLVCHR